MNEPRPAELRFPEVGESLAPAGYVPVLVRKEDLLRCLDSPVLFTSSIKDLEEVLFRGLPRVFQNVTVEDFAP